MPSLPRTGSIAYVSPLARRLIGKPVGDLVEMDNHEKKIVAIGARNGDRLADGWTPEQISGWLKSGNEPRLRAIGCETIYAFIYRTAQKAAALWRYLTRRHKRGRPRRARAARDTIKDRASIHDRPQTIESRGEAGHWEGDLIICKCHGRSCSPRGSRGNRRRNHLSDACGIRPHRSSSAKIHYFRQ
jgi:hypothetical protein